MSATCRWGLMGTGNMAEEFAVALSALPDAEVVGVGSRTPESAGRFADRHRIRHAWGSYEDLVNDRDIEVVYVATPNGLHRPHVELCLRAGKAVLCEKPFTTNADEAGQLVRLARDKGVFLMEAMWTRFLPLIRELRCKVAEGAIGEPTMLTADFGFQADRTSQGRLFDLDLGGGALLDVGIYPISLSSMILGKPIRVRSLACISENIDNHFGVILEFASNKLAVLTAAISHHRPQEAVVSGTDGEIKVHSPFWRPDTLTLTRYSTADDGCAVRANDVARSHYEAFSGNGYGHQAIEVMRCLRSNELESPLMPLDETVSIMETIDAIRKEWQPNGSRQPNSDQMESSNLEFGQSKSS